MTTGTDETQHPFAARRRGRGLCAFCDQHEDGSNHRPLTDEERAQAQAIIEHMLDIVTGVAR